MRYLKVVRSNKNVDNEEYLAHHGIKGQKWGVRRFQNPDGSLTAEGERRYGTVEKFHNSREYRKYRKAEFKSIDKQLTNQAGDRLKNAWDAEKQALKDYKEQKKDIKKRYKENGLTKADAKDLTSKVGDIYFKGIDKIYANAAVNNHKTMRYLQQETMKYYEDINKTNSSHYRTVKRLYENNESYFGDWHVTQNKDGTYKISHTVYV